MAIRAPSELTTETNKTTDLKKLVSESNLVILGKLFEPEKLMKASGPSKPRDSYNN